MFRIWIDGLGEVYMQIEDRIAYRNDKDGK